jgi:hypothetical protein
MAPVNAILAAWQQDRIPVSARSPWRLLWLGMNFPAVFDAMLDKVEYDAIDDRSQQGTRTTLRRMRCDIGTFLRFGLDWRHYLGGGPTIAQIELSAPGDAPVIAWRLTRAPTIR